MYNIDEAAQINFGVQKIKKMIRIILINWLKELDTFSCLLTSNWKWKSK
jgi:hypothetical protein